ncbi:isoaspartyl peptidase/L-asparaginase [Sphingomonas psychrotolerans]|uniref:Isoaspartyl peptidase/L-asparaginase n=1 Tax=Sphingomonas psychrotolerans TaxID=1327635 RepID=A0ABU3N695_9SPHN|nr:isoaspartyl peptidase/L-asparaginase [Sphingomonas psychrotolerans]
MTGPTGGTAWSFNTPGMYRGKASSTGERVVAFYGED